MEIKNKNKILSLLSEYSRDQSKIVKSIDSLRINKSTMLCNGFFMDYKKECDYFNHLLFLKNNEIDKTVLKAIADSPELYDEFIPYLSINQKAIH